MSKDFLSRFLLGFLLLSAAFAYAPETRGGESIRKRCALALQKVLNRGSATQTMDVELDEYGNPVDSNSEYFERRVRASHPSQVIHADLIQRAPRDIGYFLRHFRGDLKDLVDKGTLDLRHFRELPERLHTAVDSQTGDEFYVLRIDNEFKTPLWKVTDGEHLGGQALLFSVDRTKLGYRRVIPLQGAGGLQYVLASDVPVFMRNHRISPRNGASFRVYKSLRFTDGSLIDVSFLCTWYTSSMTFVGHQILLRADPRPQIHEPGSSHRVAVPKAIGDLKTLEDVHRLFDRGE